MSTRCVVKWMQHTRIIKGAASDTRLAQSSLCETKFDEPTRSFGEENIVRIVRSSFDECNTSVVLPVTHRLLKQRLVSTYTSTQHTLNPSHTLYNAPELELDWVYCRLDWTFRISAAPRNSGK